MKYKVVFLLIIAVYTVLFFAVPFEPYHITGEADYPRWSFFSYLLLPEVFFSSWLDANGEFGVADRLPVLGYVLLTAVIIAGIAAVFALLLSERQIKRISLIRMLISRIGIWIKNNLRNLIICLICGSVYFLASAIPSADYDVLSYHLAGARDFYEAGGIPFLEHNVYADMPFGTEMLYCWGMFLTGNTFTGALVGKVLIALTTLITALGLYFFCKQHVNETSGIIAALLYLTNPWVFYISTAGLNDSVLGMFMFFAFYIISGGTRSAYIGSGTHTAENTELVQRLKRFFLCGLFAGCAAGCKYTAVVFFVIPLVIFAAFIFYGVLYRGKIAGFCCLLFGILLAGGGWYIKNWYYTGNPVYPLCWNIFGDTSGTWNAAVNARWTAAHSPHSFGFFTLLHDIYRIFLSSAWNSPLLIPFAIVAVFTLAAFMTVPLHLKKDWKNEWINGSGITFLLSIYVLFFFIVWWGFTHRLERFFVPAIPFLTIIAGIGAAKLKEICGKKILITLLLINTVYCFIVCGSPAPGKLNRFLAPLQTLRNDPNVSTPWAVYFNEHKPNGKILLIGEAKAFLYDVPVLYSVCWNETPLKAVLAKTMLIKDGVEIATPLDEFRRRNIEYVLVDWGEIARFRSPGNYGFTDFVQPETFNKLVADGVLEKVPPPNEDCAKTNITVYRLKSGTLLYPPFR